MPIEHIGERRGSGDFDRGAGAGNGQILFFVLGDTDQDESLLACENDERAAPVIGDFLRGKGRVSEIGPNLFYVDFDYTRSIPNVAIEGGGQTPAEARPAPNNGEQLGRDVSFSTGGQTRKLFISKETRWRASKTPGDAPPDFGGLIGVDLKTGEIHGCDVLAPAADFTITKRFAVLTLGWFRNMLDKVAMQNSQTFLNMDAGEVLFKGCDGNYKDNDPTPWTVTARYGFSRNFTHSGVPGGDGSIDDEACTFGTGEETIVVPDIQGWNYIWTVTKVVTQTFVEFGANRTIKMSVPRWVYVERVYAETDLNGMGFN